MRFVEINANGNIERNYTINSTQSEIAQDFTLLKTTKDLLVNKYKTEFLMAVGYQQNQDRDILIYKRKIKK